MNGLFDVLHDRLPVGPSVTLTSGRRSRGWTLRPDRLNAAAARFDWIHGAPGDLHAVTDASERDALRRDVLAAAARIAEDAGFRVRTEGTGLLLSRAKNTSPRRR